MINNTNNKRYSNEHINNSNEKNKNKSRKKVESIVQNKSDGNDEDS